MITKEKYIEFVNEHKDILHRDEPIKLNNGFWRISFSRCRCTGVGESMLKTKAENDAIADLVEGLMRSNITPSELDLVYVAEIQ